MCLECVIGDKQVHAPCRIHSLHQIFLCVSVGFHRGHKTHKVDLNLDTLTYVDISLLEKLFGVLCNDSSMYSLCNACLVSVYCSYLYFIYFLHK